MKMVSLIMILILFLAGCQKSADKKPAVLTEKSDSELVSNPALSRSGALVVATDDIDIVFNPLYASTDEEKWVEDLVFDGLFFMDKEGKLSPSLADNFEKSTDGLEVIVSLKEGITFHDGTALTHDDILFTYDILLNEKYNGSYKSYVTGLKSVDIDENGRVHFYFYESLLENDRLLTVPILSKSYYTFTLWDSFEKTMKFPMGTGPFKFETYTQNESIVLIKYTPHWDDQSKLSGIVLREMNSEEAKLAFSQGKIDLMKMPFSKSMANDIKELGFGNIITQNGSALTMIGVNTNHEALSSSEVRKALLYALNREQFIIDEWQGYATVMPLVATSLEEYKRMESEMMPYPYDLEKAKQILDEQGWTLHDDQGIREKNGVQLTFDWLVFSEVDWSYNLANYAQIQWQKLGIKANIEYVDYETLITRLKSDDVPDMWNIGWQMSYYTNPDRLFGSEEDNFTGYLSTEALELFQIIDQSQSLFDKESAYQKWHLLQKDVVPYLPISRLKTVWAYNSRVKNLSLNDFGSWTQSAKSIEVEVLQ